MEIDTLLRRFESCCLTVRNLQQNPKIHRDCVKMVRSTERLISEVSTAAVECRRLHKTTLAYQEALDRARESVHNLERYVMMAQLMI
jgi:primosomal protein N''